MSVPGGQQCDPSFGQHPKEKRLGRVDPALSGTGPHRTHQWATQLSNRTQTPRDGWRHQKNSHLHYCIGNIVYSILFLTSCLFLSLLICVFCSSAVECSWFSKPMTILIAGNCWKEQILIKVMKNMIWFRWVELNHIWLYFGAIFFIQTPSSHPEHFCVTFNFSFDSFESMHPSYVWSLSSALNVLFSLWFTFELQTPTRVSIISFSSHFMPSCLIEYQQLHCTNNLILWWVYPEPRALFCRYFIKQNQKAALFSCIFNHDQPWSFPFFGIPYFVKIFSHFHLPSFLFPFRWFSFLYQPSQAPIWWLKYQMNDCDPNSESIIDHTRLLG